MAKKSAPLDGETIRRCRQIVFEAAAKHDLPPVMITAHVRSELADKVRVEVWRVMIVKLRLRRWQVAALFGRDRRRLRKSVIGV